MAAYFNFFSEIPWKIRQKTKHKGYLFSWLNHSVLVMTMELSFRILEPTVVNFRIIFKLKLYIYCRIPNVFDLHISLFNIIDRDIKIKLKFIDDKLFSLDLGLLIYFLLISDVGLSEIQRDDAEIFVNGVYSFDLILLLLSNLTDSRFFGCYRSLYVCCLSQIIDFPYLRH